MDVAKAVGVVAAHGGSIAELRVGARPDRAAHPAARHRAHHGRHRQRGDAVGGDHRPRPRGQVQRRRHPLIAAHAAVIDPVLMLGMPPAITAATGMDALAHAVECYTCDYHQFFNDAVALRGGRAGRRLARARRRRRLGP